MKITIDVDETLLIAAARRAVENAFANGDRWTDGGIGYAAIRAQVHDWAQNQDYRPVIAEVAQAAIREAVTGAVLAEMRSEARKVALAMRQTGELVGGDNGT